MYFRNWAHFVQACDDLCREALHPPRYCLRWRHDLGLLVIKVTDDHQCYKFKTRSSVFLNRFDALNRALMARFQNRQRGAAAVADREGVSERQTGAEGMPALEGRGAPGGEGGGSGVSAERATVKAKKKKGKKRTKA
ncbi:SPOSA6832_03528 [Sporobolomyces salmonicolor]|uniref:SPOSA6832_03528-mRNA-1:cds n=1 Tax=Sporidiobolus salmonicolor TaxID=5005 RepID=A0A0D6EQC0_SPOSA|nr:SPOSA6832_03528 [Sporobolomyces salmonicolor]